MLHVGSVIDGKYKVLNEIGHGGMSVVYLAINERANKTWAVKEVRKNGSTSFEVVKQGLIAETNILKKLNHPHLPSIIDVIDQDDSFLVVMDYIEGNSLARMLKHHGPQPWQDVVDWGKQLCDVLAYLHSRQPPIIYRDMKPDNVQLRPDGQVVLIDFGTAREYKYRGAEGNDTTCLGTRGYAAPEQYGGMGETDARTDIFCLGATLYHLLTGHNPSLPPYEIMPIREINPALPEGLEYIIRKCTENDPNRRYQNCTELMYDLEHLEEIGGEARRRKQKKVLLFAVSAGLTLLCALSSFICRFQYNARSSDQYESWVEQARRSTAAVETEGDESYRSSKETLERAIRLQPEDEEAYLALADLYLAGGSAVTSAENANMNALLAETKFERVGRRYAAFAFDWGSDLYFYYRPQTAQGPGEGSPQLAKSFFETVKAAKPAEVDENEKLAQAKIDLAGVMYSIGQGREMLSSNDKLNSGYSYGDYWTDLNLLLDQITAKDENGRNQFIRTMESGNKTVYFVLSIYRSIINTINENRAKFNGAGKSNSSILEMVDKVEQATDDLYGEFRSSITGDADNLAMYEYIQSQIQFIRTRVSAENG